MTEKVRNLYKKARNDRNFIAAIKSADNDKPPGPFSSDLEKTVFASIFYGYLVGKFGDDWDK